MKLLRHAPPRFQVLTATPYTNSCLKSEKKYILTTGRPALLKWFQDPTEPCPSNARLYEILEKITEGKGSIEDIDRLNLLGNVIKDASLCGLGQTSPNPVLSSLKHFRHEYLAHVKEQSCPAGQCKALVKYTVIEDKCTGCTLCFRNCPVGAITGEKREVHFIDQSLCIKCGVCFDKCKFGAILVS